MRAVVVPVEAFNQLAGYLSKRPWGEVAGLMNNLSDLPVREIEEADGDTDPDNQG
jgi:hypothetical protein